MKSDRELIDGVWVSTWRSFREKVWFQNVTDVVVLWKHYALFGGNESVIIRRESG